MHPHVQAISVELCQTGIETEITTVNGGAGTAAPARGGEDPNWRSIGASAIGRTEEGEVGERPMQVGQAEKGRNARATPSGTAAAALWESAGG